ncbi:permease-like cell division protein FtsX [Bowmanella sp. JS7-9]|uniref:Cell division protein FtsX n=1 Tax=Pseudobowmanella zhangzhouensis TaxID=1537679 RepID=A0ABW1XPV8_9ALTE|nr:permease-like cell division protein FtsX [Bowmanella sp. JS7-9]TBX23741.1 cell division protein FtsX [Bowmanella sp. JS7-9]
MSILFTGRSSQGASQQKISSLQKVLMFFVDHVRQALASLGELWRAPADSMLTIAVLGLAITLPSTLYVLVKNTEQISSGWEQAAEISLFLRQDLPAGDIQQLIRRINAWPEVEQVVHITAEQGLKDFQQRSGMGDALKYLNKNPLPDVLLVMPTARHTGPTAAALLLDKLRNEREVEFGKLDIDWLNRLHAAVEMAHDLVLMIALLLFMAVVVIIGNTIRLNILNKRSEIQIMKLVGATDAFIQRPFLYTGFWYGLLGGLSAWFAVMLLLWWAESSIASLTELYAHDFNLTGLQGNELLTMLGLSIGLGLVGSMLSVYRHVKDIEPQ